MLATTKAPVSRNAGPMLQDDTKPKAKEGGGCCS